MHKRIRIYGWAICLVGVWLLPTIWQTTDRAMAQQFNVQLMPTPPMLVRQASAIEELPSAPLPTVNQQPQNSELRALPPATETVPTPPSVLQSNCPPVFELKDTGAPPAPFAVPRPAPDDKPLPINLATALQLANARPWDIRIASEDVQSAAAKLQAANVLWVPTILGGTDFNHHDGPIQANDGTVTDNSRSSFYAGGAPLAVFGTTDAIFEPLATRQVLRAREATLQAVTNDTTLNVALAYFNVQQARADLGNALDVYQRTDALVRKTEGLVPGLLPSLELTRVRGQLDRTQQSVETARQRWRVASAELARLLRLPPDALLEPLEPPHLQVTLVPPDKQVDELIAMSWSFRPELRAYKSTVDANLAKLREERWRPFLPNVFARGAGTQTPDPLAFGFFEGGGGGAPTNGGFRDDWEVQAIWELKNFGFGNAALIHDRKAVYDQSAAQAGRIQDYVAREVAQASADVRSAAARVTQAQDELNNNLATANESQEGMGETKRVGGNIVILIVRPQEAVAAIQALLQADLDYYGAVADYNRAEFALYRALGNPAQALEGLTDAYATQPGAGCPLPISCPPNAPCAPTAVQGK
jgi:outer membrane protein TolC